MSTTPTPNERDREVALKLLQEVDKVSELVKGPRFLFKEFQEELAQSIASYRAKIESAQANRIATLEKALSEAEYALADGHQSDCDLNDPSSELPHCTCGYTEMCDKALDTIRQAKGQA